MMKWREAALGEALQVRHGFAFRGEHFQDHGDLIVLTPGNFIDGGGFKPKSGVEKYYDGVVPAGYLLKMGDVVVAMTEQAQGLLGSSATIPSNGRYLHNQRIGLLEISAPELLDLRFVYHLMNSPAVRDQIQATATGTKVRHTAPERIRAVKTRLPPLNVQRTISEILDTLDELIENNRRRVEVLEEMARAIHREWFVHFRYPGHENATLVDSSLGPIPDDWEVKPLREIADLSGGSALTKASYVDSGYVAFSAAGPDGCLPDFEIEGDGVVLSAVGARCGRTFKATGRWSSIANTIKIVPRSGVCGPSWLYLATRDPSAWPKRGSAQPFISINDARAVQITAPDPATATRFEGACGSLDRAAERLRSEMAVLAQIRDLILPRLVTGQIDVSSLDLDALVESSVA